MMGRKNIKLALEFSVTTSAVVAYFLFWLFSYRGMTLVQAATGALIASSCFFAFLLAAFLSGRWRNDDLVISPWFAWFVAGGSAVFWLGVVIVGQLYGGVLAVCAWGIVLFGSWLLVRLLKTKA